MTDSLSFQKSYLYISPSIIDSNDNLVMRKKQTL